jgi:UDP-GlcNAc:undecaprenyl-phosphate/decaprenyl-phosphate GlcNAc-1-phosphate transferase
MGIMLYGLSGHMDLALWCFAMIAAIVPYILLNLGILAAAIKSLWAMPAVR